MTIREQRISRIIKELEGNPEPNLSITQLIMVIEYLEKLKKKIAKSEEKGTFIDGIRVIF